MSKPTPLHLLTPGLIIMRQPLIAPLDRARRTTVIYCFRTRENVRLKSRGRWEGSFRVLWPTVNLILYFRAVRRNERVSLLQLHWVQW